jgi:hypothetical protein
MQRSIRRSEAFDRRNFAAFGHCSEGEARENALAIDQNGACPALTVIAAFFAAGEAHVLAQRVEQRGANVERQLMPLSVHMQFDFVGAARIDARGGCIGAGTFQKRQAHA